MKKTRSLPALAALAALAALGLAAPGRAAGPRLDIPDFSHLSAQAVETVDVNLDGFLMSLAKKIAAGGEARDDALSVLRDIESVRVRSYDFNADDVYSKADVEAVRKQLLAPGWSPLAQVRRREDRSKVDVYLNSDGGKVLGMAVVVMEPRSFTIVNIVGNIDLDRLARLEGQFGIPGVSHQQ